MVAWLPGRVAQAGESESRKQLARESARQCSK